MIFKLKNHSEDAYMSPFPPLCFYKHIKQEMNTPCTSILKKYYY